MLEDARLDELVEAVIGMADTPDLRRTLDRIVESAMRLTEAGYGALGVIGDTELADFIFSGVDDETVSRIGALPTGHGILGLLIEEPEPLRLADLSAHPRSVGFPDHHPPMSSFLGAPVRIGGSVFGNLYLTEKQGGGEFSLEDERLLAALASIAGSAIQRARLHGELQHLGLVADRERIGRELHDTVIQRLFATGLQLQAVAARHPGDPDLAGRIDEVVEELDDVIRVIRSTILDLRSRGTTDLRGEVLATVRRLEPALGFHPSVRFVGPLETVASEALRTHAVAVLGECLTNVARHARARSVDVLIAVEGDELSIAVTDDGVGHEGLDGATGFGLRNLRERAAQAGGGVTVTPAADGQGTRVVWTGVVRSSLTGDVS